MIIRVEKWKGSNLLNRWVLILGLKFHSGWFHRGLYILYWVHFFFSWNLKHTCSQCFGMMQIKFRISVIFKFEVMLMKRKSALESSSIHGLELKCYITIYLVLLKFATANHMTNTSIFFLVEFFLVMLWIHKNILLCTTTCYM